MNDDSFDYPDAVEPDRVGEYPALAKAGGGYVWDEILEYRVWCYPVYALKSLSALRHGEVAHLRWSQYDATAKPLGRINLGETKSGVPRAVPVHPTLAKLLATWKLSGWSAIYGRRPSADDLIVPTRNMSDDKPHGTPRDANESQRQLVADLQLLKLRTKAGKKQNRRGHDMRRTFITLARTDGAIDGLLRWVAHGPTSDMMDVYSSPPWSALCAEVGKLKLELREGALVPMSNSGASRWMKPARSIARAPGGHQAVRGRVSASTTARLPAGSTD